jgi:hypothetical protein
MAYDLGHGIRKLRKMLLVFDNCAAHPHLDSLKICSSQHNIPGTASGHGDQKRSEDLLSFKVGKLHP